jgi:hypothetical protein
VPVRLTGRLKQPSKTLTATLRQLDEHGKINHVARTKPPAARSPDRSNALSRRRHVHQNDAVFSR